MISVPESGWCHFQLGDFEGDISYLTDAIIDLMDAFTDYYTKGQGMAVFDEEGSYFTLVMSRYSYGTYIIEDRESAILHDFSYLRVIDLAEELIKDIERDPYEFEYFLASDVEKKGSGRDPVFHQVFNRLKHYVAKAKNQSTF